MASRAIPNLANGDPMAGRLSRCPLGDRPRADSDIQGRTTFPSGGGWEGTRQCLWLLNELWNRDKHRSPAISVANIAGYEATLGRNIAILLSLTPDWAHLPYPRFVVYESRGQVEDGQIVLTLDMSRRVTQAEANEYLDAYGRLAIGIAFEDGPPANGVPVRSTLRDMATATEEILERFETHLGPRAIYPTAQCPDPQ